MAKDGYIQQNDMELFSSFLVVWMYVLSESQETPVRQLNRFSIIRWELPVP